MKAKTPTTTAKQTNKQQQQNKPHVYPYNK